MSSSVNNSYRGPFIFHPGIFPPPFREENPVERRDPTPGPLAEPRTPLTPLNLLRARSDSNVSYPSTAPRLLVVLRNTRASSNEPGPNETKTLVS